MPLGTAFYPQHGQIEFNEVEDSIKSKYCDDAPPYFLYNKGLWNDIRDTKPTYLKFYKLELNIYNEYGFEIIPNWYINKNYTDFITFFKA